MGSILIALPKLEDARHISDLLKRQGLNTALICTSGSKVLSTVHELDSGVVICGRRLTDMHYTQLAEYLPEYFEMLLIASQSALEECPPGIKNLGIPFRASELTGTVEMMLTQQAKLLKKKKIPKKRSEHEQNFINNAKGGIDGKKWDDGDRSLSLYSEMQYGFRYQYGGDCAEDLIVDV